MTAKDIAVMKMDSPIPPLSKCTKDKTDKKAKKDKKSKKAKKPKKIKCHGIKNARIKVQIKKTDKKPRRTRHDKRRTRHGIMFVPGKVQAAWEGLWGQEFKVAAVRSHTIGDIKHHIFVMTGVSAERQRLIFAGRVLGDDKTFAFYKIPDGAELTYEDKCFPLDPSSFLYGSQDSRNTRDIGCRRRCWRQ